MHMMTGSFGCVVKQPSYHPDKLGIKRLEQHLTLDKLK
jgi:hypothetical protein